MQPLGEPDEAITDPGELLLGYLDYYRATVVRKLTGLDDEALRTSRLPSGWAPLELLQHLAFMERRWVEWGFAGQDVPDPWGDTDLEADRWAVSSDESLETVSTRLRSIGDRTREIAGGVDLTRRAPAGPRFEPGEDPPALAWILLHVLQEYARHAGHLDVARELLDGTVGE